MIVLVDGFLLGGIIEFENKIISKLRDTYLVGSVNENSFRYVGYPGKAIERPYLLHLRWLCQ